MVSFLHRPIIVLHKTSLYHLEPQILILLWLCYFFILTHQSPRTMISAKTKQICFTVLLKKNVTYIFDGLRVTVHFHLFNISFLWTLCFTAGQFYHGVNFEVSDLFPGKDPDKQDANMFVKGNKLTVTRWMKTNIKCIVEFTLQERQKINSVFHSIPHESRGWQRDFRQDVKNGENVPCWFIHNNGSGLLDGVHTDYIVSDLFKTI